MKYLLNQSRAVPAILFALAVALTTAPALADIKDYAFELAQTELKAGEATVEVRLLNTKTGAPVPDAVIFTSRLDMAPDGMEGMTTPLEALPSTTPGTYRFKTNLTMAGRWQLSLAAKIQGETGSVDNKLVIQAIP